MTGWWPTRPRSTGSRHPLLLTARAYRALGYDLPADVDDDEVPVLVLHRPGRPT